jgi:hypothetical protein
MHYMRWYRWDDPLGSAPKKEKVISACLIAACPNQAITRGYCNRHYQKLKKWGDPTGGATYRRGVLSCDVPGCAEKYHTKGLCRYHHGRRRQESPKGRFENGQRVAGARGISWEISTEEHSLLLSFTCFYCGNPLHKTGTGLDRKDSALGYTWDNVVPCCGYCNTMKQGFWTFKEFCELADTETFQKILKKMHEENRSLRPREAQKKAA